MPIPAEVRDLFETDDLEGRFGLAYELATVDEDGWPRIAMLSHGEITTTADSVRLVLWGGSSTGKNLASGRPALLSVVSEGLVCYLSGRARHLRSASGLDAFELTVERVRIDTHQGFPVRSPIRFEAEDGDRSAAVEEWRRQLGLLEG
ncbi:MAG: hypothetical protein ACRDZM_03730 [Acidimicrobiia bacterium]